MWKLVKRLPYSHIRKASTSLLLTISKREGVLRECVSDDIYTVARNAGASKWK
jgi:hypothetical protein